jgi:hypothetical protein
MCVALAVAACSGSRHTPAAAGIRTTVDSSGSYPVTTVSGEAPMWRVDSLAVITPDSNVGFSQVRTIALDPAGGIWIPDTRERTLARFGDDGHLIETRGRVGAGPGEFRSLYAVTVFGGKLWLFDPSNARTVRWTAGGAVDSSWIWFGSLATDATLVRWYPTPGGPYVYQPRFATPRRDQFIHVPTRSSADTVAAPTPPWPKVDEEECNGPNGSIWFWPSPFHAAPISVPYRGRVVTTSGAEYRLASVDASGDTVALLVHDVPRAPITDQDWRDATADYRADHDTLKLSGCHGATRRYPAKPAIRAMTTDEDGRLWVERWVSAGLVWEAWRGDTVLGRLPEPRRLEGVTPSFLGDRFAVATAGPVGGVEVRLYRFRPE